MRFSSLVHLAGSGLFYIRSLKGLVTKVCYTQLSKQSLEQEGPGLGNFRGITLGMWVIIWMIKFQEQRRVGGPLFLLSQSCG